MRGEKWWWPFWSGGNPIVDTSASAITVIASNGCFAISTCHMMPWMPSQAQDCLCCSYDQWTIHSIVDETRTDVKVTTHADPRPTPAVLSLIISTNLILREWEEQCWKVLVTGLRQAYYCDCSSGGASVLVPRSKIQPSGSWLSQTLFV